MYRCRQIASQCSSTVNSNLRLLRQGNKYAGESSGKRSASDYGKLPTIKPATMNEMPAPQGSWAQNHARKQAKYNLHLFGGIGLLGATIFVGVQSGALYLNLGPDLKNVELNIVTHEQLRQKAAETLEAPEETTDMAALAAEPVVEAAEPVVEAAEPVVEAAEPIVEAAEPVVEAAVAETVSEVAPTESAAEVPAEPAVDAPVESAAEAPAVEAEPLAAETDSPAEKSAAPIAGEASLPPAVVERVAVAEPVQQVEALASSEVPEKEANTANSE